MQQSRRAPDGTEVPLDSGQEVPRGLTKARAARKGRPIVENGELVTSAAERAAWIARLNEQPARTMARLEGWARETLKQCGVPLPEASTEGWIPVLVAAGHQEAEDARGAALPHSLEWCAARVLLAVTDARKALDRIPAKLRPLAEEAALALSQATLLQDLARFKQLYESNALGNLRQKASGKSSAAVRKERNQPKRSALQSAADGVWRRHPKASKAHVAKELKRRGEFKHLAAKTIANNIKKPPA